MSLPEFAGHLVAGVIDTARWDSVVPRPGDIIVDTPGKCGTTWTQMLCALLVHGAPPWPEPLSVFSPWIDGGLRPNNEDHAATFNAQSHQRIFKTHCPLFNLRYREDAFYVVCGRDPRDALLSSHDHVENGRGPAQQPPNEMFPEALENGHTSRLLKHIESFWAFRSLPNILFLHYEDMSENLEDEMARLELFLGFTRTTDERRALLKSASLDSMRETATGLAPMSHIEGRWKSDSDFFKKGRRGEWRDVLSAENHTLYLETTRARHDHVMLSWLENGRAAIGDPRAL